MSARAVMTIRDALGRSALVVDEDGSAVLDRLRVRDLDAELVAAEVLVGSALDLQLLDAPPPAPATGCLLYALAGDAGITLRIITANGGEAIVWREPLEEPR